MSKKTAKEKAPAKPRPAKSISSISSIPSTHPSAESFPDWLARGLGMKS